MSDETEVTYRLVGLRDGQNGPTAATRELAMLASRNLGREQRLGIERTEWAEHNGKMRASRTVLIEAESRSGEWELGGA